MQCSIAGEFGMEANAETVWTGLFDSIYAALDLCDDVDAGSYGDDFRGTDERSFDARDDSYSPAITLTALSRCGPIALRRTATSSSAKLCQLSTLPTQHFRKNL